MDTTVDRPDEVLVEQFPDELVDRSWRNYLLFIGIPCAVFCCFPFLIAASLPADGLAHWFAAALVAAMLLAFTSLLVLSTGSDLHRRLRSNLPTVQLHREELTLQCGHATVTADIRQCRVRRGRACSMRICAVPVGITMYCWFPVILIHMPPFERTIAGVYYSRSVVAVGLDEQSLNRWERALLPLVGEPSDEPKSRSRRF